MCFMLHATSVVQLPEYELSSSGHAYVTHMPLFFISSNRFDVKMDPVPCHVTWSVDCVRGLHGSSVRFSSRTLLLLA